MAKVESKTKVNIETEVMDYKGHKKGHFQFTLGSINFWRANAQDPAGQYTYQ